MSKRMVFVLAALALPLLVWGCSKPPEVEIQQANAALQAARTAEAQQYAPQSLTVAQDTLNAALAMKQEQDSKFALFRSYGKSKEMFLRAAALSQKAESDAKAEKERVRQEVTDLIAAVTAELDAAKLALQNAPKGKGNKVELELITNEMAGIESAFMEAKAEFDTGRFLTAKAKVEAGREQIRRITDEIAAAAAKKR